MLGNTVIVVEHDEDTMFAADHIVDIGPGAGEHGGEVIAEGTAEEIMQVPGIYHRRISQWSDSYTGSGGAQETDRMAEDRRCTGE